MYVMELKKPKKRRWYMETETIWGKKKSLPPPSEFSYIVAAVTFSYVF